MKSITSNNWYSDTGSDIYICLEKILSNSLNLWKQLMVSSSPQSSIAVSNQWSILNFYQIPKRIKKSPRVSIYHITACHRRNRWIWTLLSQALQWTHSMSICSDHWVSSHSLGICEKNKLEELFMDKIDYFLYICW